MALIRLPDALNDAEWRSVDIRVLLFMIQDHLYFNHNIEVRSLSSGSCPILVP